MWRGLPGPHHKSLGKKKINHFYPLGMKCSQWLNPPYAANCDGVLGDYITWELFFEDPMFDWLLASRLWRGLWRTHHKKSNLAKTFRRPITKRATKTGWPPTKHKWPTHEVWSVLCWAKMPIVKQLLMALDNVSWEWLWHSLFDEYP